MRQDQLIWIPKIEAGFKGNLKVIFDPECIFLRYKLQHYTREQFHYDR